MRPIVFWRLAWVVVIVIGVIWYWDRLNNRKIG